MILQFHSNLWLVQLFISSYLSNRTFQRPSPFFNVLSRNILVQRVFRNIRKGLSRLNCFLFFVRNCLNFKDFFLFFSTHWSLFWWTKSWDTKKIDLLVWKLNLLVSTDQKYSPPCYFCCHLESKYETYTGVLCFSRSSAPNCYFYGAFKLGSYFQIPQTFRANLIFFKFQFQFHFSGVLFR